MAKKLSTTPKAGKFIYPRLNGAPDFKFNKLGVYSTKFEQAIIDGQALIDEIDAAMEGALVEAKEKYAIAKQEYSALGKNKNGKKPPTEPKMVDKPYFTDDENGVVTFTFKMTASGESKKTKQKFTQKPALFDAKGKPVVTDIKIGTGTTGKISYEVVPFVSPLGAGASLRLKAAQIIELVEWGSGNAEHFGFGEEEGFSAPTGTEAAEQNGFTDESTTETDDDQKTGSESDDF
jgi:hypothetical protein